MVFGKGAIGIGYGDNGLVLRLANGDAAETGEQFLAAVQGQIASQSRQSRDVIVERWGAYTQMFCKLGKRQLLNAYSINKLCRCLHHGFVVKARSMRHDDSGLQLLGQE